MYMYFITNNFNLQLFQVRIIVWVIFMSFDSDVTSYTPAFCVGGYILVNQSLGGGIAFS